MVRDLGHGSWSQEKAYVSGIAAANKVLGRSALDGVEPLRPDEPHVAAGAAAAALRGLVRPVPCVRSAGDGPALRPCRGEYRRRRFVNFLEGQPSAH